MGTFLTDTARTEYIETSALLLDFNMMYLMYQRGVITQDQFMTYYVNTFRKQYLDQVNDSSSLWLDLENRPFIDLTTLSEVDEVGNWVPEALNPLTNTYTPAHWSGYLNNREANKIDFNQYATYSEKVQQNGPSYLVRDLGSNNLTRFAYQFDWEIEQQDYQQNDPNSQPANISSIFSLSNITPDERYRTRGADWSQQLFSPDGKVHRSITIYSDGSMEVYPRSYVYNNTTYYASGYQQLQTETNTPYVIPNFPYAHYDPTKAIERKRGFRVWIEKTKNLLLVMLFRRYDHTVNPESWYSDRYNWFPIHPDIEYASSKYQLYKQNGVNLCWGFIRANITFPYDGIKYQWVAPGKSTIWGVYGLIGVWAIPLNDGDSLNFRYMYGAANANSYYNVAYPGKDYSLVGSFSNLAGYDKYVSGYTTLFMSGRGNLFNEQVPLIIPGAVPVNNNTPLYTAGPTAFNGNTSLYIAGPIKMVPNISLYTRGSTGTEVLTSSNTIPLLIKNTQIGNIMPLNIVGKENPMNTNISMFAFDSTGLQDFRTYTNDHYELLVNPEWTTPGTTTAFLNWSEQLDAGSVTREATDVHSSPYAAKVTCGVGRNTAIYQYNAVTHGEEFRVRFWAHGDAGRYGVYANGGPWLYGMYPTPTGSVYQKVEFNQTIPYSVANVGFLLYGSSSGGVTYYDDVSMRLAGDHYEDTVSYTKVEPTLDGQGDSMIYKDYGIGFFSTKWDLRFKLRIKDDQGAEFFPFAVSNTFGRPTTQMEHIQDCSFEYATGSNLGGYWGVNVPTGSAIQGDSVIYHTGIGTKSAKFTNTSACPITSQVVNVSPSTKYRFTFWTRGYATNTEDSIVSIVDNTNNNATINSSHTGVTGAEWQQVTIDFTTPAACSKIKIYFYGTASPGTVWYDDVLLKNRTWSEGTQEVVAVKYSNGNLYLVNYETGVVSSPIAISKETQYFIDLKREFGAGTNLVVMTVFSGSYDAIEVGTTSIEVSTTRTHRYAIIGAASHDGNSSHTVSFSLEDLQWLYMTSFGGATLATFGGTKINNNMLLYIQGFGNSVNSYAPLMMFGGTSGWKWSDASAPLLVYDSQSVNNFGYLYINGSANIRPWNDKAYLHIIGAGDLVNDSIPLLIGQYGLSQSATLFMKGPSQLIPGSSGVDGVVPIYVLRADESTAIPLFIANNIPQSNTFMSLIMNGITGLTTGSATLVLPKINQGLPNATSPLFVQGGVYSNSNISLSMSKTLDKKNGNIGLVCFHDGGLVNTYIPLYINSVNSLKNNVTLVLPKVDGLLNGNFNLFTSGY